MTIFGPVAWLRNAELFEVLLGWFGRVGPIGRRVVVASVCDDCGEACDPARCVDCPECAAAAGAGEREPQLRPWFTGLLDTRGAGWSDAAFIVLALSGVTFDGLQETIAWGTVLNAVFVPIGSAFGYASATIVAGTGGLVATWLLFLGAFTLAASFTRWLGPRGGRRPLRTLIGPYAATLLPIAGGYLVAHYLTLLLQGLIWVPELIRDPRAQVAPQLDWIPISAVWYLSVTAIVLGHVVAIVLAHRLALRDAPQRPVLAGLPLVMLMVAYTVLSLWIIAQPIVLEPGQPPPL